MEDYSELRAKVLSRFAGHDYTPAGPVVFAWHVHHDILAEALTEPVAVRVDFIIANKPASEIETRLEWLRPVKGTLPAAYDKASAACNKARAAFAKAWAAHNKASAAYDKARAAFAKAWAAYNKAWAACNKARAAFDKASAAFAKAWAACKPELEKLHAAELPDCPWDGETLVFPARDVSAAE